MANGQTMEERLRRRLREAARQAGDQDPPDEGPRGQRLRQRLQELQGDTPAGAAPEDQAPDTPAPAAPDQEPPDRAERLRARLRTVQESRPAVEGPPEDREPGARREVRLAPPKKPPGPEREPSPEPPAERRPFQEPGARVLRELRTRPTGPPAVEPEEGYPLPPDRAATELEERLLQNVREGGRELPADVSRTEIGGPDSDLERQTTGLVGTAMNLFWANLIPGALQEGGEAGAEARAFEAMDPSVATGAGPEALAYSAMTGRVLKEGIYLALLGPLSGAIRARIAGVGPQLTALPVVSRLAEAVSRSTGLSRQAAGRAAGKVAAAIESGITGTAEASTFGVLREAAEGHPPSPEAIAAYGALGGVVGGAAGAITGRPISLAKGVSSPRDIARITEDPYALLGIRRGEGLTRADVDAAFRRRAAPVHPDQNPAPEAEELFKRFSQAREAVLEDIGATRRGGAAPRGRGEPPPEAPEAPQPSGRRARAPEERAPTQEEPPRPPEPSEAPGAPPETPRAEGLRQKLSQAAGRARRRMADVLDPERAAELQEAYQDPITELPNQAAFERARPRLDANPEVEIVQIDLTNFKAINDNLGREAGDARLQEVADALRTVAEARGIEPRDVFRAGGDEFAVAVPAGQGQEIGGAILDAIEPLPIPDTEFVSRARYGVGDTFFEADEAAQGKKATEEGPRFRDLKAERPPADPAPGPTPAPAPAPAAAPEPSIRVEPAPEGEEGFVVRNVETGEIEGGATRREAAERLARQLQGDQEPVEEAPEPEAGPSLTQKEQQVVQFLQDQADEDPIVVGSEVRNWRGEKLRTFQPAVITSLRNKGVLGRAPHGRAQGERAFRLEPEALEAPVPRETDEEFAGEPRPTDRALEELGEDRIPRFSDAAEEVRLHALSIHAARRELDNPALSAKRRQALRKSIANDQNVMEGKLTELHSIFGGEAVAGLQADVDRIVEGDLTPVEEPPTEEEAPQTEQDVQEEVQRRKEEGTLPRRVYEVDPAEIDAEPDRFQFKMDVGPQGVGRELQDVETFDENLAGVVQVWRDPEDGRLKVVNGHHRLELAKRLGADRLLVRELDVPTAADARRVGALTNIAEGRGTPVDAAKLFRDEGITEADLDDKGISLKGETARLGVALSNLHQTIFREVATGRLKARRAAVIGEAGLSEEQQLAVWQMARDLEEKGNRPTNAELEEIIRFAQGAGESETTQETLFGEETVRQSNALEKAQLSAWVKRRLSKDRRLFGFLTRADRAERIEQEGVGAIDVGRSEDIATTAAQAEELYERLSTRSGPISDALNRAAARLAQGDNENDVRQTLYQEITEALEEFGAAPRPRGSQGATGRGAPAQEPVRDQEADAEAENLRENLTRAVRQAKRRLEAAERGETPTSQTGIVLDDAYGRIRMFGRDLRNMGRLTDADREAIGEVVDDVDDFLGPSRVQEGRPAYGRDTAIEEAALEEFGTTANPFDAGWILEDGQMLDLSKGGGIGRVEDHRSIGTAYPEDAELHPDVERREGSNVHYLRDFVARGNVRFFMSKLGEVHAEFSRPLTSAQVEAIVDAWRFGQSREVFLDASTPSGGIIDSWPGGIGSERDLRRALRHLSDAIVERNQGPGRVRERDLFGKETPDEMEQGELLGEGGPQGITEAENQARATVSQLEGKVQRGEATESEERRYNEARTVLRRLEGMDEDEIRARRREEGAPEPDDDTLDLFDLADGMAFFEEGRVGARMDRSLLTKLGANMYTQNPGWVIPKEALQNAVDAVRNVPGGRISVRVDTDAERIDVRDTGLGMTPDVAANQFMDPGGSEKPGGSSGGYGLAKVGLFSNARIIHMETVADTDEGRFRTVVHGSADDWVNGEMRYTSEKVGEEVVTGTLLELHIEPDSIDWHHTGRYLQAFVDMDRTGLEVDVEVDGREFSARESTRYTFPSEPTRTEEVDGAIVEFWESDQVDRESSSVSTVILNNGLYQFNDVIWLDQEAARPKRMIINVKPTVDTTHPDYPFTTSRESLKGDTMTQVKSRLRASSYGQIEGTYRNLIDLLLRPNKVPGTEYGIYPGSDTLTRQTVARIATARYLPGYLRRGEAALDAIARAVRVQFAVGEYTFGGVGLSPKYVGANINSYALRRMHAELRQEAERAGIPEEEVVDRAELPFERLIVLNPYRAYKEVLAHFPEVSDSVLVARLAEQTWATLVHEMAHQIAHGHTETFAGVHTRMAGLTGRISDEHISALEDAWREILASDEFRAHQDRIEREWSDDDTFAKIGSHEAPDDASRRAEGDDQAARDDERAAFRREGGLRGGPGRPGRVREGPEGGEGGAGRRGAKLRRAHQPAEPRQSSVEDQLELTFGSTEAAADVIREISDEVGVEFIDVSVPGKPNTRERIRRVLAGRERGFAWVKAVGRRVATVDGELDTEALYRLMRAYRHPAAEYWHILVLQPTQGEEFEVAHHRMTTAGAMDAAMVHFGDVGEAAGIAARLGGQVVMVHNHPSGDPRPSPEDRAVTRHGRRIVEGAGAEFGGHMVIDGEEATLMETGDQVQEGDDQVVTLPPEPGLDDWNDMEFGPRLKFPGVVFGYMQQFPTDASRVDVLLVNSQHEIIGHEAVPLGGLDTMAEWLPRLQREAAAVSAVLVTSDEFAYGDVIRQVNTLAGGVDVLDVLDVTNKISGRSEEDLEGQVGAAAPTGQPVFERGAEYEREAPEVRGEGRAGQAREAGRPPAPLRGEGVPEPAELQRQIEELQGSLESAIDRVRDLRSPYDPGEQLPDAEIEDRPLPPPERGFGEHGYLDFGVFTGGRSHPREAPLFTSQYDEVEQRWQAAKGAKPQGLAGRAAAAIARAAASFTRQFPLLDPNESDLTALTVDVLRQEIASPHWGQAVAYDELRAITEGLDADELDVLTRNLALPDIIKDIERGLYGEPDVAGDPERGGKELPFGYDNLAAVEADLAQAKRVMAENPTIESAFERRQEFNERLTRELVEAELLPEEVLDDDRYYHRQVLTYLNAANFQSVGTTGGRDIRLQRRGYQRHRVGGSDFNTAYQEAEFEWVAQGYAQLARVQTLARLKDLQDIKGTLKKEARAINERRLSAATEGDEDPLLEFRQRIAFSNQNLAELAAEGDLPHTGPFGHVAEELAHQWRAHQESVANAKDMDLPEPSFRFEHEDWFNFLRHLLTKGEAGAREAGTIFKAMAGKDRAIKDILGPQFVTWEELVPEGHTTWQPEKGSHFFMGLTVEERVLERAIEENRALQRDEVRQMLVVGGPKEQWVIPEELAETLDNFRPVRRRDDPMEDLWVQAQQSWRQWVLLMPFRALKYNLNNQSGDLDISLAYDPKIAKSYWIDAAKDLYRHRQGTAPDAAQQEILRALRLGVLQSGLRVAEIPDITDTGAFRIFTSGDPNLVQKVVEKYWDSVRAFTDWRENSLRLAAFRYFKDRLAQGERNLYAASNPEAIDAIEDPEERAAKLARELIGDYGAISRGGEWLRRRMISFYAWLEINAGRWIRMARNIRHEGQTEHRGRRWTWIGTKKTAWTATKLGIKANLLFAAVNLWNLVMFPEEHEQVNRNRRQLHIILGRRDDGTIISLRFEGALSDFLEWVNLQNYPSDIADLVSGDQTVADMAAEAAKAPIEKTINSLEPFAKTVMELSLGRRTWPTIFEEGASFRRRTSPIRDPAAHALNVFSVGRLVDVVRRLPGGRPPRPTRQTPLFDRFISSVLLYQTDPGQAAYWAIRGEVFDWLRDQGRVSRSIMPAERDNALYYWKRAVQWGDEEAADAWHDYYVQLGGTDEGLQRSAERSAPLDAIPDELMEEFLATLEPREREMLEKAQEWYGNTLGAEAGERARPRTGGRSRGGRRSPRRRRR